ncbi:cms1 ribosomal small subunit [Mactra antiquata]
MADDLGDDWWEDDNKGDKSDEDIDLPAEDIPKPMDISGEPIEQKKKKKNKRKKITDELKEKGNTIGNVDDFIGFLSKQFEGKLSQVELDEIKLDKDRNFYLPNTDPAFPVAYFRSVLPKWKKLKESVTVEGSPVLLVICASALRAVELSRQLNDFKGDKCKCAKLFAKHMKVTEQEKFLKKSVCHMGIGTPNRMLALLKSGYLKLDKMTAIVIDWNWRDVKKRRAVDIPEIKSELTSMFKQYLIPHVQTHLNCKIGML